MEEKKETLFIIDHDLGCARLCLEKALTALSAVGENPNFIGITSDYILEANAKYLYMIEKAVSGLLNPQEGDKADGTA